MNKEEILKKSRETMEDEGDIYVKNKGRHCGVMGFCFVFCIIILFNIFNKQNNFVPNSMFMAYIAAEAYGEYRVNHKKVLMVTTVSASIASICFLVCHIINVLGV